MLSTTAMASSLLSQRLCHTTLPLLAGAAFWGVLMAEHNSAWKKQNLRLERITMSAPACKNCEQLKSLLTLLESTKPKPRSVGVRRLLFERQEARVTYDHCCGDEGRHVVDSHSGFLAH